MVKINIKRKNEQDGECEMFETKEFIYQNTLGITQTQPT
jgi:hypothetical protein